MEGGEPGGERGRGGEAVQSEPFVDPPVTLREALAGVLDHRDELQIDPLEGTAVDPHRLGVEVVDGVGPVHRIGSGPRKHRVEKRCREPLGDPSPAPAADPLLGHLAVDLELVGRSTRVGRFDEDPS